jgi:energy-converting hydrogenase Eha subunit E
MMINVSALMLHVGAIILLVGIVTKFIWRKENDPKKAKIGLKIGIAGVTVVILSFATIILNSILL